MSEYKDLQLPKADSKEVRFWSSTPPPSMRKDGVLYRESEVEQIQNLIAQPGRKAVLLEGKGGAGKSTTMVELAHVLNSKGENYALFSPKDLTPDGFQKPPSNRVEEIANVLEEYAKKSEKPILVLMDSGDYLFCRVFANRKSLKELELAQSQGQLTQVEANILKHYKGFERLIDVLAGPQFKIVTTWHTDWPSSNQEPTLFEKWRKIIPPGSEFQLSPKVPMQKGLAFLQSRKDLQIGSYAPVIATALEFGELKNLTQKQYDELEKLLKSNVDLNWSELINDWATKNLSRK